MASKKVLSIVRRKDKRKTVSLNLTLDMDIFQGISKIKKQKGLPFEQDVIRLWCARGVQEQ